MSSIRKQFFQTLQYQPQAKPNGKELNQLFQRAQLMSELGDNKKGLDLQDTVDGVFSTRTESKREIQNFTNEDFTESGVASLQLAKSEGELEQGNFLESRLLIRESSPGSDFLEVRQSQRRFTDFSVNPQEDGSRHDSFILDRRTGTIFQDSV